MEKPGLFSKFGESPLTDPKSLGGSLLFHGMLLVLASVAALSVAMPGEADRPPVLRGEFDPVDNKVATEGEGGGDPGNLAGARLAEALATVAPNASAMNPEVPAPAEALLAEILPSTTQAATNEAIRQALPGPQTSSFGGAFGDGGGGGSGGGVGGGIGRGVGPGTEFFGTRERAGSFAYVIDCSGSMAMRNSLDVAKRELLNSLERLPPDARFGVIFYNLRPTVLTDPQSRPDMMPATAANKARVTRQLASIVPDGGTDHMSALRAAMALRPEVIFFLTDADLMNSTDAQSIIAEAGATRIQAVEFGRGAEMAGSLNPLRKLATSTGGAYRYIDVTGFPRAR